ncbi:MAG TPA: hypothetical protein PK694_05480 [Rhodospirillales bacterium]|jgi:hypothetical protein|nr:hypothetical protein [Rhodospirillales bacterium]
MKIVLAFAAVALLAFAGPAAAKAEPALTGELISSTISAMGDLQPVMEKHEEALAAMIPEEEREGLDPCNPPEKVRSSEAYAELEAVVRKHGFASGEQWCRLAKRVTAAYAAVKLDAEEPQWREKMAEVRQQIESAPNLSPEQRAELLNQLAATTAMIGAQQAPEADKAVVKANLGDIEAALKKIYSQE